MSKECKHEEWNPCGNDFYSCRKCGILRTSQQVNLYAEKDRQISDLEAKLAESEKSEETYKSMFEIGTENNHNLLKENKQLKQQLAEKDRELYLTKDTLEHHINIYNSLFESRAQDKISFALEQLEKVKNRIESKVESVYKRLDDLNIKIVCENTSRQLSTYEEIVKEIDNQIKAIKGDEE